MIYYSFFNPLEMQSMVWTFLHPVQQTTMPEAENVGQFSTTPYSLSGSSNQELKEISSPITRNCECLSPEDNSPKLKNKSDRNKKIKQKSQEEEFKPNMHEVKKIRRTPQNSNRNVVPNIMHQVISFLQKKSKSERLVEKYIKQTGIADICSVKRFYYYQLLIKEKLNHYVNADSLAVLRDLQEPLCEVYSECEQRHYNTISRLLIQYFLTREFDAIILTSKRVNSEKRLDHLMMKRKILEQITEMFAQ